MWSVRKALVLTFLAVVALPLTMFWLWPHTRAMQNEVRQVHEKHLLLARNVSAALDRYSRDLISTFDFLADSLISSQSLDSPVSLLQSLRFRYLCLIDLDTGGIIKTFDGLQRVAAGVVPADKIAALVNIAETRKGLPSRVMAGADGSPEMALVRVTGNTLVLGIIDTEYFRQLGRSISFGIRGHAVIVDHLGRVLAHPMPEFERQMTDLSKLSAVQRTMRGETGVETFYSPAHKDNMIAGITVVPQPEWGVMVPQPLSELSATAEGVTTSALSIFSMGLIVAALVALRFSLLVLNPLNSVMNGARRMANGEADVQISITGRFVPYEFANLASTFNSMALKVSEARVREAEARARAEATNAQKTEFVSYITHELRSPINAILGFARVLAAQTKPEPQNATSLEQIHLIQDAGTHLLSLVNDLLDLGKIESGQYPLSEAAVGVDELVERCFGMVGEAARARAITLNSSYEAGPPGILVDERAMYQVLLNLITNAVSYGRTGGAVQVHAGRRADGVVEICVVDDGPGIEPADLERVMRPFERLVRHCDPSQQGTGLGLPIVKKLVELHDGRFLLASQPGIGTVAFIELPAGRCLNPATAAAMLNAA